MSETEPQDLPLENNDKKEINVLQAFSDKYNDLCQEFDQSRIERLSTFLEGAIEEGLTKDNNTLFDLTSQGLHDAVRIHSETV